MTLKEKKAMTIYLPMKLYDFLRETSYLFNTSMNKIVVEATKSRLEFLSTAIISRREHERGRTEKQ